MSKKEFGAIIASAMLFGFGCGVWALDFVQNINSQKSQRIKPGVYVNGGMTSTALIAIGLHALKDNLYDTYELHDILKEVGKKEIEE